MFAPLKDVLPVASAPSKRALFRFACRNGTCMCKNIRKRYGNLSFFMFFAWKQLNLGPCRILNGWLPPKPEPLTKGQGFGN